MSVAALRGDLRGRTIRDLPEWCDLTIAPYGNPAAANGAEVSVVWNGRRPGLYYIW